MGWTYRRLLLQLVTGACQRAEGWVGHIDAVSFSLWRVPVRGQRDGLDIQTPSPSACDGCLSEGRGMGWTYRQLVTGACQKAEGWVGHTDAVSFSL